MLDAKTSVPLYQQLMDKLKNEIAKGTYAPGDQLPPEIELAKQNNVSVVTARKAVRELAALGLVVRTQGKGTFVSKPKYGRDFTHITSFSESCRLMGVKPGSKLVDSKIVVPNDALLLTQLQLPPSSKTVYISRLRYVDDEPVAIESSWFSLDYAFLLDEDLENSLFDLLWNKIGIRIEKSRKRISVCRATTQEGKLLGLRKNHPLLLVRSVAYTGGDMPVYVCNQIINGERFELMV